MTRTRIKICGITRLGDLESVAVAGADAMGLVFYPPSPRYVDIPLACELARSAPPFLAKVGLFVNPDAGRLREIVGEVSIDVLQFQGDEPPDFCEQFGRPYLKVARMRPGLDLVEFAARYASASGLLLDAYVEGFGGAGTVFDWSLVPDSLPLPVLLAGGLTASNVGDAIRRLRPWAVDVSSGVESAKGIKDAAKIAAFVAAVKSADAEQ